jgi:hypothetical protein
LRNYYRTYADLARRYGLGIIYESPTWRASWDWGLELGFSAKAMQDVNCRAIDLGREFDGARSSEDALVRAATVADSVSKPRKLIKTEAGIGYRLETDLD